MTVLCIGMQRSASTWSFNVCRNLLEEQPGTTYGGFHSILEDAFDTILQSQDAVIKSHSLSDVAKEMLIAGKVRAVYTHRDAHDAIASQMQMFGVAFDDALSQIQSSLLMIENITDLPGFLALSYEQIILEPRSTVKTIATFLGFDVTDALMEAIVRSNSFDAMKDAADSLAAGNMIMTGLHTYDRKTLLHPSHIRNGSLGYGRKRMTDDQQTAITAMLEALPQRVRETISQRAPSVHSSESD